MSSVKLRYYFHIVIMSK